MTTNHDRAMVQNLDPRADTGPHEHKAYTTIYPKGGSLHGYEICGCGSRREVDGAPCGPWFGGVIPENSWEKAHLEAVRRAVDSEPALLMIDLDAIQNLHSTLLEIRPSGTEDQDQEALAKIYSIACSITHSLFHAHGFRQMNDRLFMAQSRERRITRHY